MKRSILAVEAPLILAIMASVMMRPPSKIVKAYRIPRHVIREGYGRGTASRDEVRTSLRKVRNLLDSLGLITPVTRPMWRAFGIWETLGT